MILKDSMSSNTSLIDVDVKCLFRISLNAEHPSRMCLTEEHSCISRTLEETVSRQQVLVCKACVADTQPVDDCVFSPAKMA